MKRWIQILVTGVLVFFLIRRVEWGGVFEILTDISWPLFFGYILIQLLGNVVSAWKWQYLAAVQETRLGLVEGFFAYLTGAFINNFLPSTIGGDAYRTLWLSKRVDTWRAFTVVAFDRISGLLGLFLAAAIGLLFLPGWAWHNTPWFLFLLNLVLGVAGLTIVVAMLPAQSFSILLALVQRLPWPSIPNFVERFAGFVRGRTFLEVLGFSLLFVALGVGLNNYFLFQSLRADLGLSAFLGAIFLATLVANIPISINNIGVKEWSYVFFFGLVGVSAELAVAVALLSRVSQMLLSCLALPHYLKTQKDNQIHAPYSGASPGTGITFS